MLVTTPQFSNRHQINDIRPIPCMFLLVWYYTFPLNFKHTIYHTNSVQYRHLFMGSCIPVSIRISTVSVLPRSLSSLANKSLSISNLNSSSTFAYSKFPSEIMFFCLSGIVISVILPTLLSLVTSHPRFKVTIWLVLFIMSNRNLWDLPIFTIALTTDTEPKLLVYLLLSCSTSYSFPPPLLSAVHAMQVLSSILMEMEFNTHILPTICVGTILFCSLGLVVYRISQYGLLHHSVNI